MESLFENIIAFGVAFALLGLMIFFYLRQHAKKTKITTEKIVKAKEFGLYEPVSLHPVVNQEICIGSGACIEACPEKDILGIVHGKATPINASRCVGHGACFHACPVRAISLCIGTEKRGVDLPHVSQQFETNVPMIFIAGELGGMGLIKNALEQGKQAVGYITKKINKNVVADYDVAVIGAGPAGIGATLTAVQNNLKYITFEQDTLGGTINSFPRGKIVMTSAMDVPLYGKIKLSETTKPDLIEFWNEVLSKNNVKINEEEKVAEVVKENDRFLIKTSKDQYTCRSIVIAIGRRGSPRKMGVPGEEKSKVYYRLLEPELIHEQKIVVVGGGDSAIESALLLADEQNEVTISYRSESFGRLKPKNLEKINIAIENNKIRVIFNSDIIEVLDNSIRIMKNKTEPIEIPNDIVYVFIGGELPTQFLNDIGILVTKKHGDAIMSHRKN